MGVVIHPVALLRVAAAGDLLLAAVAAATVPPAGNRPAVPGARHLALPARRRGLLQVTVLPRARLATGHPQVLRPATVLPRARPATVHRLGNPAEHLLTLRPGHRPEAVSRPVMSRRECRRVRPDMDLLVVHLPVVCLLVVHRHPVPAAAINLLLLADTARPARSHLRAAALAARPGMAPLAVASVLLAASVRPAGRRPVAMVRPDPAASAPLVASDHPVFHPRRRAVRAAGCRWRR